MKPASASHLRVLLSALPALLAGAILSRGAADAPWPGWRVRLGGEVLEIGSLVAGEPVAREVELAGERVRATPIHNGSILAGLVMDVRTDSDAWQAFLKDNASFYAGALRVLDSSMRCEDLPSPGTAGCRCDVSYREEGGRQFRVTQEACEGDGDMLFRSAIEFGRVGEEVEAEIARRIQAADAEAVIDPLSGLAQAEAVLREHPSAKRSRAAARAVEELRLIGQRPALPAPRWWPEAPAAGSAAPDSGAALDSGTVALLFFEAWDPHSPEHLPGAARLLRAMGVRVIGVHRGTKGSTDAQIRAVAATFAPDAILRDDGALYAQFHVSGIPAVAVLHRGAILWRDHPKSLVPSALERTARRLDLPPALPPGFDACGPPAPTGAADVATADVAAAARALAALAVMEERKGAYPQLPCEYAVFSERREPWQAALTAALRRAPPPWTDTGALSAWLTALPEPEAVWYAVWEAQPERGRMTAALLGMSRSRQVEERRAAAALLIRYSGATYAASREALARLAQDEDLLTRQRAQASLTALDLDESTSGGEGGY